MIDKDRIVSVLETRIPAYALEDKEVEAPHSVLIDPTLDHIEAVIRAHLIDGKTVMEIKREVKSTTGKKLATWQIKQSVKEADAYKAAELAELAEPAEV